LITAAPVKPKNQGRFVSLNAHIQSRKGLSNEVIGLTQKGEIEHHLLNRGGVYQFEIL
jgi:hypothetical protein